MIAAMRKSSAGFNLRQPVRAAQNPAYRPVRQIFICTESRRKIAFASKKLKSKFRRKKLSRKFWRREVNRNLDAEKN
jgi:hypothetical protein